MNFYLQVFLEAAHNASFIPLASEATFFAMKSFGGYDMNAALVLAVLGAMLGQILNWYVGRGLFIFEYKGKIRISHHRYERVRALFNKYGIFLLLFCWVPLGNLLVIVAGFLGVRLNTALPLILIGLAAHYGWALM